MIQETVAFQCLNLWTWEEIQAFDQLLVVKLLAADWLRQEALETLALDCQMKWAEILVADWLILLEKIQVFDWVVMTVDQLLLVAEQMLLSPKEI